MKFLWILLICPIMVFGSTNISIVGDSITAGAFVKKGKSYVDLLRQRYVMEGKDVKISDCPFNGAMTKDGPGSIKELLDIEEPDYLIIFLGINDAGHNVPEEIVKENFSAMISMAQHKCKVILCGVNACTVNPGYNATLVSIYFYLFKTFKIYPVMILDEKVLATAHDGIHPNVEGHQMMADYLYDALKNCGLK